MIDHASIAVSDLVRAGAFYDRALAPLGHARLAERERTIGYGKRYPELWLNLREGFAAERESGAHLCLRARTERAVRAFHEAALAAGGADDGEPGPRRSHLGGYFGAFVRDPDGNRIEAMTVSRPERE
ncbi:MAG: VOC family protein [Pseudomonadota bacterium]